MEHLVGNWHATIVDDCKRILDRQLTEGERTFITSRGAFVALEAIHDHVRSLGGRPEELERYLRSETDSLEHETRNHRSVR